MPVLVLGVLAYSYTTSGMILVLRSLKGSSTWLEGMQATEWLVFNSLQVLLVSFCFLHALQYSTPEKSDFDKKLFFWCPAVVTLLCLPAHCWFTILDAASGALVFAPVATVAILFLCLTALDREESVPTAQKLE